MPLNKNKIAHKASIRKKNERLILNAAEVIFAAQGFKGTTISKVAQQAKIPKANIYYYFPTKDILYSHVIEDICDFWLQSDDFFDDLNSPAEILTRYINAKMDFSRSRPLGSRIWANEMIRGAQYTKDYVNKNVKNWLDDRIKIIQRWVDNGDIDPIDPRTLIYMIWATTQHYADFGMQIKILNGNKQLSDKQFETAKKNIVTIILKGIGASNNLKIAS